MFNFKFLRKMKTETLILEPKGLNFDAFEALNEEELTEVEGGVAPLAIAIAVALYFLATQELH
jgi:class IIb bacteriocin, lactobin A/cerein 7B family